MTGYDRVRGWGGNRVGRVREDCSFSEAGAIYSQQEQERKSFSCNRVAGSALHLQGTWMT